MKDFLQSFSGGGSPSYLKDSEPPLVAPVIGTLLTVCYLPVFSMSYFPTLMDYSASLPPYIKEVRVCRRTQTPAAPRSPPEAHGRETLKLRAEAKPAGRSTDSSLLPSAGEGTCGSRY